MENTKEKLNVVPYGQCIIFNITFWTASPMPSNSQNEHTHWNPILSSFRIRISSSIINCEKGWLHMILMFGEQYFRYCTWLGMGMSAEQSRLTALYLNIEITTCQTWPNIVCSVTTYGNIGSAYYLSTRTSKYVICVDRATVHCIGYKKEESLWRIVLKSH